MFRDREDAAVRLAELLKGRELRDPLVLAIPRGGVVLGVVLARELGADLDVVLSRKLRAPGQPELAVGAVSEDGRVYLHPDALEVFDLPDDYYDGYRARVRAMPASEVRRVAREQLRVSASQIVVVGDPAKIAGPLAALGFGPVHQWDALGAPLD